MKIYREKNGNKSLAKCKQDTSGFKLDKLSEINTEFLKHSRFQKFRNTKGRKGHKDQQKQWQTSTPLSALNCSYCDRFFINIARSPS